MGDCTAYPQDGSKPPGAPEQFWNCAEVTILPAFPTVSPKPSGTPTPTESPTVKPEPVTYPPNPSGIPFPCCSWYGDTCTQPENDFCHMSKSNCESSCSGSFLDPNEPTPTGPSPTTSGTPAPFAPVDIPTTGIPCCSDDFKRCIDWCGDACHQDEASCLEYNPSYYFIPWGAPTDLDSCIAITYSCVGHPGVPCCPGMICNPGAVSQPCIPDPDVTAPVAPPVYPEPVAPPVAPPVTAPISPPVSPPVAPPVPEPVAAPVSQPIAQPVAQPVAPPVAPPIAPPVTAPVASPDTSNGIPLPCCGWANEGCSKPNDDYCQGNSEQCTGNCAGMWYTSNASPVAPPSPPTGGLSCCTWGGWSVCPDWTQDGVDDCQTSPGGCSSCNGQWIDGSPNNRKLRGSQA